VIDDGGFAITIGQPLLHSAIDSPIDGGLTKLGIGTLTLTGANTYNGNTIVSAGTLALSGSGSISNSTPIAIASGATLDVSARTDQTLTLSNGQTLTGSGNLKGKLIVSSGATVNPGDTIGTLTVQSNIVLNGTVVLELNRTNAPTSDKLTSTAGTITGNGTLTVTNLGPALQVGNTFQLFSQAVSGFATVNLSAGYLWANNLASNGTIQVTTVVSTNPTNLTLQATSNSLTLSWPFNHTSWRLQAATNLFGSSWVDVAGSTATNSMLIPVYPTNASLFFRLVYP
jgi:autotransporter-associated beta strand protein